MAVTAPNIIRVQIPASNYRRGRTHAIDQITFHHIVGDAAAAIARFKKEGEQASSTYVISSTGQIYQLVDENDTPYTDANGLSNSRAITIEHAGGHPAVPYTDAMYAASMHLVAWIRSRRAISRYERHRNVSDTPTACPGTLNVEGIVDGSSRILSGQGVDMANFTMQQEQVAALMATGSKPGENYNYEFSDDEINSDNLNKFLQTWLSRQSTITREMENAVADGISGIKNYIGWAGYNSQYVGKPVVSHAMPMFMHWLGMKPATPPAPVDPTQYEKVTETLYRKKA